MARLERLERLARAARESAQVAADDREARDRAIEQADRDGVAVRAIARACGMNVSYVHRIIATRTARRQADKFTGDLI